MTTEEERLVTHFRNEQRGNRMIRMKKKMKVKQQETPLEQAEEARAYRLLRLVQFFHGYDFEILSMDIDHTLCEVQVGKEIHTCKWFWQLLHNRQGERDGFWMLIET